MNRREFSRNSILLGVGALAGFGKNKYRRVCELMDQRFFLIQTRPDLSMDVDGYLKHKCDACQSLKAEYFKVLLLSTRISPCRMTNKRSGCLRMASTGDWASIKIRLAGNPSWMP